MQHNDNLLPRPHILQHKWQSACQAPCHQWTTQNAYLCYLLLKWISAPLQGCFLTNTSVHIYVKHDEYPSFSMIGVGLSLLQLYKSLNRRPHSWPEIYGRSPCVKSLKYYFWWQMNMLDYAQEPVKAMPSFKQLWMLQMVFKTTPHTWVTAMLYQNVHSSWRQTILVVFVMCFTIK